MELRKTPFYQKHIQDKGRIVDFAGWALPVEYESMLKEAKSVRTTCGIFDVSHMGEIFVSGDQALSFLQRLLTNDIASIAQGRMQYNLILNDNGGVLDDLMVYNLGESILCVVNASNKDKIFNWFSNNLTKDVKISDDSDNICLISIQGPNSEQVVGRAFGKDFSSLEYMSFIKEKMNDGEVIISRSGYSGEDGFEIYLPFEQGLYWWDKIVEAGKEFDLKLCGLGSRDILRIEAGYPLYGHELNEEITPYQARLGWAVKLNKDFIGKLKLLEEKEKSIAKKRIGFIMQDKAFPRQGYPIYFQEKNIGFVTSGVFSPNKEAFIGMGYVENNLVNLDDEIYIDIRGRRSRAKVVNFAFIEPKTKKGRGTIIAPLHGK